MLSSQRILGDTQSKVDTVILFDILFFDCVAHMFVFSPVTEISVSLEEKQCPVYNYILMLRTVSDTEWVLN